MGSPSGDQETLAQRVAALGLGRLVAAADMPVYLVGGAVRDLLLGREPLDLDVAVEGDAIELAGRVADPEAVAEEHESFGTATVLIGGLEVNIAATRAEEYRHPGALPEVRAATLAEDLRRRDFTVNAIAIPLAEPSPIIDPHGGLGDIDARVLRILHPGSFTDDPTRALRAARYAARLGFALEPATETALRDTDLTTVSADRVEAELARLTAEANWRRGFELLAEWDLADGGDLGLMAAVERTLEEPRWRGMIQRSTAMLAAGPRAGSWAPNPAPLRDAEELVGVKARTPSAFVAAARNALPLILVLGRALGAEWLDRYVDDWRDVRLEITGEDLIAAGVPEGPAVGAGLSAALAAKLDGQVGGREEELERALAAARSTR